jgi:hypothetical protein
VATSFYLLGLRKFLTQDIDWVNDDIRAMLCTSAYTPNFATNEFASTAAAEELTGYTRPLLVCSINTNTGDDRVELVANDIVISSVATGQTIASVVVFKDTGSDATSPLIGVTTGLSQSTNGGDILLDFSASGFLAINRTI